MAASCGHAWQVSVVPRGARTGRGPAGGEPAAFAAAIRHLAGGVPSLGGSGVAWFDRVGAYSHPRDPASAGFRRWRVRPGVSRDVVPGVPPTGARWPGCGPLRAADPSDGQRARSANYGAGDHARSPAPVCEDSPVPLSFPHRKPVQGLHLASATRRVPAPAVPLNNVMVPVVLRGHDRGGADRDRPPVHRHAVRAAVAEGTVAVRRAFKFRAYPTRPQEGRAARLLADHCDLYNAALEERREAWRDTPGQRQLRHAVRPTEDIRRADPPGQGRHSFTAQQQTLRRLNTVFAAFYARARKGKAGYPRFKPYHRFRPGGVRRRRRRAVDTRAAGRVGARGIPGCRVGQGAPAPGRYPGR